MARHTLQSLSFLFLLSGWTIAADQRIALKGLSQEVEILRDRWGIPHIYAKSADDVFFAQGYIAARDRLFQLDMWRRTGTGRLAEVLGPEALPRDRIARLVRYRGDWKTEWNSYSSDAEAIARAFTSGINAYIQSLGGKRPPEFAAAGWDPGLWQPEDVASRVAGLVMVHNFRREVQRSLRVRKHGLAREAEYFPPDPPVKLEVPAGLDLADINEDILRDFLLLNRAASGDGPYNPEDEGSNNWVVDGTRTKSGKPLFASDPHRPILMPSLRKTVHLVAPGWNVIGAGEPALPGIALGHNEEMGFGFTIVGIDQADFYVERLNPENHEQYWHQGAWKKMEVEKDSIPVKGAAPAPVELRYTAHGPVFHVDAKRHRAYALKWVGAEPGGAGYLAALRLSRARNWAEFLSAAERYRVPSENLVYADRSGNIGWVAAGATPIRKGWTGLLPVPGDTGAYEWQGYLPISRHPQLYNPPSHQIATANHNILPNGYRDMLTYEWAAPFRYQRVLEMLKSTSPFTVEDFQRFQQDVGSIPARRFQEILTRHLPKLGGRTATTAKEILAWDGVLTRESRAGLLFELWVDTLYPLMLTSPERPGLDVLFAQLDKRTDTPAVLQKALEAAWLRAELRLGRDATKWTWGGWHQLKVGSLPALSRPGDANTVNATSGPDLSQKNGASFRQILDTADWDQSVMTNFPGESGDPLSPHYKDLVEEWNSGRYHPMVYSRKAVEAATAERIWLVPAK